MREVYLGRQPIYDSTFHVEGYELFHHPTHTESVAESATPLDSDLAKSKLLFDALAEVGVERLVGDSKVFLGVAREFIVQGYLEQAMTASSRLVCEVVADIVVDTPLVNVLNALRQQGYHFLLNDYVDNQAYRALLGAAEYVRLNMSTTPESEIRRLVLQLQRCGVALIAGGIEDQEILESCQALQFNYFQGQHFSKPRLLKFHGIPTNHLTILRLISELNQPDVDMKTIESLIAQDVSLSYKLLRHINSAYFNLSGRVESIQRAVALLGLRNVRSWATLLSLSSMDNSRNDLLTVALIRAKMCELLGERLGLKQRDSGFTVGLLSTLDLVMQAPIANVLAALPLEEDINAALLRHEGVLGQILACVLAYEQCDWVSLEKLGLIDAERINDAYLTALADAYRASYELLRD